MGKEVAKRTLGVWLVLQQCFQECEVEKSTGRVDRWVLGSKVRSHLSEVWAAGGMLGPRARVQALAVDEIAGEEGRLLPRPLASPPKRCRSWAPAMC